MKYYERELRKDFSTNKSHNKSIDEVPIRSNSQLPVYDVLECYKDPLLKEVLSVQNPIAFFSNNRYKFKNYNLKEHLEYLLTEKNIFKSKIIADSGINATYAYHIFSGDKKPSRDKLLALSFSFKLNICETQHLLRHAEAMELCVCRFRDAVIIYSLANKYSLMEANNLLHDLNENSIE